MKRILIIDDEPNVRLNFRLALEVEGYAVIEAASAAAAREKLLGELFDLAILDLRMPGMDGLELLAQMREEGMATPVIIVTAHGSVPDAVRAMKLGAIDFLEKPLRPAELRRLVAEVADRHHEQYRERTEPDNFATHLRAAKRHINLRNFTLAEKHLKRALEYEPRSADALNLLGVLAELRDDYRTARKYYGRAIRAKHNHEAAQQNMRRLFELNLFGATDEPLNLGD
ncbi:MAG: response regulator [Verrucomicrobia bacterium]|nr:response regulator [Verrucomicrobiota bacterium]